MTFSCEYDIRQACDSKLSRLHSFFLALPSNRSNRRKQERREVFLPGEEGFFSSRSFEIMDFYGNQPYFPGYQHSLCFSGYVLALSLLAKAFVLEFFISGAKRWPTFLFIKMHLVRRN